jgi:catechol 2,3-dioxygenase-like lactoylglutathione lyase family enzyme
MPDVRGILETALYVRDLRRSAEFYERVVGARVILDTEKLIALNIAGRSVLLLFKEGATGEPAVTPGGVIPPHRGAGPTHFAFSIGSDEVASWKQFLETQSVAIESGVKWPGGAESIYFRDPDMNLVELITPGFWQGVDG